MAKRTVNPEDRSRISNLTDGPNMFDQQGNTSRGSTRMPWPEGYRSDDSGGNDDDRGRGLPRGYRRGDGSSGRYE